MSDCCGSSCETKNTDKNPAPRKFTCPANSEEYIPVATKTMLQHLKSPWNKSLSAEQFYFCSDNNCDVVYFGLEGSVINKNELRQPIGVKEKDENALICYCFGVTKTMAKENSEIKNYVKQQTKQHNCACDIRNPSGRCCLKDFPK